jgi:predicted RNA-binding protein Jag
LDSLSAFAKEHLGKAYCSVAKMDVACTDEEKALIAEYRAKSKEELQTIAQTATSRTLEAQGKYDQQVEELQATYERITQELSEASDAIRAETNVKWVNQILLLDHPGEAKDPADEEL